MLRSKVERSIRAARCVRGKRDTDEKMIDALEDAARSTCRKMEALMAFRSMMARRVMETDGNLFDFMLLWFLGGLLSSVRQRRQCRALCTVDSATLQQIVRFRRKSFQHQVAEVLSGSILMPEAMKIFRSSYFLVPQNKASKNAYKEVVDANKARLTQKFPRLLRELAVLEEEKYKFHKADDTYRQMKFSNPDSAEMMELAKVLHEEDKGLTMLCKPKPFLTRLENFRLALLHARLWLLHSELPVCFGSSVSYKKLRSNGSSERMIRERAEEPFPSLIETQHMEATVFAHSVLVQGKEVYHIKEEDYLPSARWRRPGYPLIVTQGGRDKSIFVEWRKGVLDDEDLKELVTVIVTQDTPRVLGQLRKLNPQAFEQFGPGL